MEKTSSRGGEIVARLCTSDEGRITTPSSRFELRAPREELRCVYVYIYRHAGRGLIFGDVYLRGLSLGDFGLLLGSSAMIHSGWTWDEIYRGVGGVVALDFFFWSPLECVLLGGCVGDRLEIDLRLFLEDGSARLWIFHTVHNCG